MLQSLILQAMLDFFLSLIAFFCVYHSRTQMINAITILVGTVIFCSAIFMLIKGFQPEHTTLNAFRIAIIARLFSLLLFESYWQQKAPVRQNKSTIRHF